MPKRTRCSYSTDGPDNTPIRPLKVFISSNEKENHDINHPQWETWKILTSDQERYEIVQKLWRNNEIPTTRANLGAFNWRKRNGLPPVQIPYSSTPDKYLHIQAGTLDQFFEWRKWDNDRIYSLKREELYKWMKKELCKVDEELMRNLAALYDSPRPSAESEVFYNRKHQEALDVLKREYQQAMHKDETEWQSVSSKLDSASNEIRKVAKFYSGLHKMNSLQLSKHEMTAWIQREDVLTQYSNFYSIPSKADYSFP